ncbi:MAG: hypothetical protein NT167_17865, partial [Verrucomicrobia bacterium]|nr:hypothetical protein [Verrucomicrobiota bacterium]
YPKGIRRVSEGVNGPLRRFGVAWLGLAWDGGGGVRGRMAANGSGRPYQPPSCCTMRRKIFEPG